MEVWGKNQTFSILSKRNLLHILKAFPDAQILHTGITNRVRERNQMHTYKNVPLVAKFRLLRASTAYRGGLGFENARPKPRTVFTPTAIECKKKSGFASEILNKRKRKSKTQSTDARSTGFKTGKR